MELWKELEEFPQYQISSYGRVKSFKRYKEGKILKTKYTNGYSRIGLINKEGKQQFVNIHRLVATAFIPNPNNLPVVNHKDENKLNNHAENLEWCTIKQNINYGNGIEKRRYTNAKSVKCVETGIIYKSFAEAARETGTPASSISSVFQGKMKKAGGHHWELV